MGTNTTPWDNTPLQFAAAADAIAFEGVLRHCLANAALVAEFDRLTTSNLRLAGAPVNVAVDLHSGRTDAELRRFAGFVKDVVWDRLATEPNPSPVHSHDD